MAKYKPFRADLSNPVEFYKGKKDEKGQITHQYRLEGNLASYNAPSRGGKRAKTVDFGFYHDMVNLMASRPLEPSKEWKAYTRQTARKNGMSYSWLDKKGLPPGWSSREAERQTFYDSLMRIGEKYSLSLNQITQKMEALSYVASDVKKRLPRDLMTDISALHSIVGSEIPREKARAAGKMLEKIEAETKGKEGPPQYTPFTRKLTEGLGEQPEKESIDWALSKVKRYRWKDKHRGMGGDWKEAPHLEQELEREAAESKGKATAGMGETQLLGIKGGAHYKAKSVIYGDVLKLQRQFNELARKKRARRKR